MTDIGVEMALKFAVLFGVCVLISGVAIRLSVALAARLGIMDRPGGHKQHEASTPFVGGFGLIAVLIGASILSDRFFGDALLFPLQALIGLAGILNASPFLSAVFGVSLPNGLGASEVVEVSVGGVTEYLFGFSPTNSGVYAANQSSLPFDLRSYSGNYDVKIPEPESLALLADISPLTRSTSSGLNFQLAPSR